MSRISHHPVAATAVEQHPAGAVIEAHVHDDDQLIAVRRGFLAVATRTGTWAAVPGRAVLVPGGVWHRHRAHRRTELQIWGIGDTALSGGRSEPRVVALDPLMRALLDARTARSLPGAAVGAAEALLATLIAAAPDAELRLPEARDARLAAACRAAEQALPHAVPMAELARRCGTSERSLSRAFSAEFGMTYPQWRLRLRVFHAAAALLGDEGVTDVAARLGWATPSAFSVDFKRLAGSSPSAYRLGAS